MTAVGRKTGSLPLGQEAGGRRNGPSKAGLMSSPRAGLKRGRTRMHGRRRARRTTMEKPGQGRGLGARQRTGRRSGQSRTGRTMEAGALDPCSQCGACAAMRVPKHVIGVLRKLTLLPTQLARQVEALQLHSAKAHSKEMARVLGNRPGKTIGEERKSKPRSLRVCFLALSEWSYLQPAAEGSLRRNHVSGPWHQLANGLQLASGELEAGEGREEEGASRAGRRGCLEYLQGWIRNREPRTFCAFSIFPAWVTAREPACADEA